MYACVTVRPVYEENGNGELVINIQLNYFNTSSAKCLFKFFGRLDDISRKNDVTVNWYCEEDDIDMQEVVEDFESMYDLPINMVEVEEIDQRFYNKD